MKKGRKIVTVDDIRPFLARTGQLHLIAGASKGAEIAPIRPNSGLSALPGDNTAGLTPEVRNPGKKRREMNKTEAEFSRLLEIQRQRGEIVSFQYEAITLRWGTVDGIRYTPDFTIFDSIEATGIRLRFVEVKGAHIWPKDMQKFKAARNEWHGIFTFELWQKTKEGWGRLL